MDETPTSIKSAYFDKDLFQKQVALIKEAATKAEDVINYEQAHNPEILRAIDVVEDFLRRKHRLCYGGQAINAHLPTRYKIYDPELSIPDYDFFTPDQEADIVLLTNMLRKAGFDEISAREGVHEGTIKMYVNYTAVADITRIDPKLYRLLSKREFKSNGISYLDADTLRMMMYLELSRPMGMVSRWEKVFERLMLLNEFVPIGKCHSKREKNGLTKDESELIMRKIIAQQRIFAGGDLLGYYNAAVHKGKRPPAVWLIGPRQPIFFYSPNAAEDAADLSEIGLDFKKIDGVGDVMPKTYVAMRHGQPVVVIVEETACHAYYNIPLRFNENIRVASLDTLITLYFSLSLLESRINRFGGLHCVAQELVEISYRARAKPEQFPFPFVSLKCSGHQKTLSSLIREKVKRVKTVKQRIQEALVENKRKNMTIKNIRPKREPKRL